MSFLPLWLYSGLLIFGLMTLLWLLSLALGDASIMDIFWGTGFMITFWAATLLVPGPLTPRLILLGTVVTVWGCVSPSIFSPTNAGCYVLENA